jgi:carbamoyltransferase
MKSAILGISAYYHDSAAVLIDNGKIIAAAQEERFTRKKHDQSFPVNACKYVLDEAGLTTDNLIAVAFYDKPLIKFERLIETYHAFAPRGLASFFSAMPVWIKEKMFLKKNIQEEIKKLGFSQPPILFPEHHLSHAASAFYPSPFNDAAIVTIDGVGEWATTTICHGQEKNITLLREMKFPHSIGLLYSSFTYYCGFKVNSGEYKLMGLAPYGDPDSSQYREFKEKIVSELISLKDDGSILLNMKYFDFATDLKMVNCNAWERLFKIPKQLPEAPLNQSYMNLALAIQHITEEAVVRLAKTAKKLTGSNNLTLAGGVALNCVANGKLLKEKLFDNIWVQPAAGDAGGALGAALAGWHIGYEKDRTVKNDELDSLQGSYLGPQYTKRDILKVINTYDAHATFYDFDQPLCDDVAILLSQGKVGGWFQGRMEWGPRALGNRSILGDPRDPKMQKRLNLKIKYREGFRPFAPAVLAEDCDQYFDLNSNSPYMQIVAPVQQSRLKPLPDNFNKAEMMERLYFVRSDLPAITHVDFSARIQTVHKSTNFKFWNLLHSFKKVTGCSVLVNTSFNVRGEPIVCTPDDAYRCFMNTEMDFLVIEQYLFIKTNQPTLKNYRKNYEFELD